MFKMTCKNKNILFLSLIFFIYLSGCQESLDRQTSIKHLYKDLDYLSSDLLEGRETGSDGARKAADYIAMRFKEIGLEPKGTEGFFQEFSFTPKKNPHVQPDENDTVKIIARNVIGIIDNQAENTIILGAHFDHLGYGDYGSLYKGDPAIHNGADDNASGVAALILLGNILKDRNLSNNYLFIAFSGEEKGLFGSNYFCKNPTIALEEVNYMINMDMVGRLNEENALAIHGVGTSPSWNAHLEDIDIDSLKLITNESGIGPSDHTSFYLKDIPVLHFFTGQHEDYHKPSDDVEKINFDGIYVVAAYIDSLITRLDGGARLAFTKTKDESKDTPKFTVTLGVMPDYMYDGKGMRIDGVSENKPAKKAGLLTGDIVVKLGDFEVSDMMTYMEALSQFKKGDATEVTVKRGNEHLTYPIQF
jgi:hypothetical protein